MQKPINSIMSLLDFSDLAQYRAFSLELVKSLADLEYTSLRAVEESYSVITGLAVRYCQLLVQNKCLSAIIPKKSLAFSFYDEPTVSGVHADFLRSLTDYRSIVTGRERGITLFRVHYHGREFCVRAVFGGWHGGFFGSNLDAQENKLDGKVHFLVDENDQLVGKICPRRLLKSEYGETDEPLMLVKFVEHPDKKYEQVLDGDFICEYSHSDDLLGHFLHQLMMEIFSHNQFENLDFRVDNECRYIAFANGFRSKYDDESALQTVVLERRRTGKTLADARNGGASSHNLSREDLSKPQVYFVGSTEPTSWQNLIEQSKIIADPEQIKWPAFKGVLLPCEDQQNHFSLASIDLSQKVTCHELLKIGRCGLRGKLTENLVTIECYQTSLEPITLPDLCVEKAQVMALYQLAKHSLLDIAKTALLLDPEENLCRDFVTGYVDKLVATFEQGEDPGSLTDLFNHLLEQQSQDPQSQAIKICKEIVGRALEKCLGQLVDVRFG